MYESMRVLKFLDYSQAEEEDLYIAVIFVFVPFDITFRL